MYVLYTYRKVQKVLPLAVVVILKKSKGPLSCVCSMQHTTSLTCKLMMDEGGEF